MPLQQKIQSIAQDRHTDYFGIADLTPYHNRIPFEGGMDITTYPRAISIGITMFHDIVDQLPNRKQRAVCIAYKHHCYDVINVRLDNVISELSSEIQHAGHRVYPIPASKRVNDKTISAVFSHKMAAHLSGLGWIGKSCLLITPDRGPRVRWATLLTDAPLSATGTAIPDQCGECRKCVDICPVAAFTGRSFHDSESRELRYNALKCQTYFRKMQKNNEWALCGMCVYVCPNGQRNS